jgi:hypothetical protein
METYYTDNQKYTGATVAGIQDIEPALKNAKALAVNVVSDTEYSVAVESKGQNKVVYTIKNKDGVVNRTCLPAGKGGCKAAPDADGNSW